MSRMIQWCDGPTPNANRPPANACVENAWRARAIGCWACSGTTAVPSSMRELCAAISDTMVRQSKSFGTCGIQSGRFGPFDIGGQLGDLAGHVATLGADHHSDAHGSTVPFR